MSERTSRSDPTERQQQPPAATGERAPLSVAFYAHFGVQESPDGLAIAVIPQALGKRYNNAPWSNRDFTGALVLAEVCALEIYALTDVIVSRGEWPMVASAWEIGSMAVPGIVSTAAHLSGRRRHRHAREEVTKTLHNGFIGYNNLPLPLDLLPPEVAYLEAPHETRRVSRQTLLDTTLHLTRELSVDNQSKPRKEPSFNLPLLVRDMLASFNHDNSRERFLEKMALAWGDARNLIPKITFFSHLRRMAPADFAQKGDQKEVIDKFTTALATITAHYLDERGAELQQESIATRGSEDPQLALLNERGVISTMRTVTVLAAGKSLGSKRI